MVPKLQPTGAKVAATGTKVYFLLGAKVVSWYQSLPHGAKVAALVPKSKLGTKLKRSQTGAKKIVVFILEMTRVVSIG